MNDASPRTFRALEAATGEALDPEFPVSTTADVAAACEAAAAAFDTYRELPAERRAAFLDAIGDEIMALGDELLERANKETGLPIARLTGERGRTVGQLKLFAQVVRDGLFRGVRVDPAMPNREPLPRPDLRLRKIPVGPVAVFGASNFPLAFSTAGGDTASALAAGCPVVVKGHSAHPGTGLLVAQAIARAAEKTGMPAGVFGHVMGNSRSIGESLVADPRIAAVGFTGSRGGGLALQKIAQNREVPIPVYAEMSSINPVVLFPAAAKARGAALGEAYAASLTMGAGQFCTNPGLVIALDGSDLDAFVGAAAATLGQSPAQQMLTPAIHSAFGRGVDALRANDAVETVARGPAGEGENQAQAALFGTGAAAFAHDPALGDEVFGSSSIVVRAADPAEIAQLVGGLEGQLTATLLFDEADEELVAPLIPLLARKAGRILANGWPTGVEVCHAMVHGGPFPATSDSRTTSVGALAIMRFLRPVCYQNLPDHLLPAALRQDNPYGAPRRVDGVMTLA